MAGDLGYFGPESVTWRVLTDPAAGVGGVRALFLQALHPLAMAGVHEHAGFETDFWLRLQRTAQYVTTVGFGTALRPTPRPLGSARCTEGCVESTR